MSVICSSCLLYCFFFFNDTATTEIYTLSLHDALPICAVGNRAKSAKAEGSLTATHTGGAGTKVGLSDPVVLYGRAIAQRIKATSGITGRSEEHTSELQSRQYLVCRLLLEKKKNLNRIPFRYHLWTVHQPY